MTASGAEGAHARAARPRRRWRRLVRAAAGVALAGLAALVLALVLLHTPFGRAAAKRVLETNLGTALGGRLRLATLDYRLWAGSLDAAGLRFRREGLVLEAARAGLRWSPRRGLQLRLEEPRLLVRESGGPAGPASGALATPWTLATRFADFDITGARIELQSPSGRPWLRLAGLDATMHESRGQRAARIKLGRGTVHVAEGPALVFSGLADVHLAGTTLVVDALHLGSARVGAELSGQLGRLRPGEASADVRVDAEPTFAALFAPTRELVGALHARAHVEWRKTWSGRIEATSPALSFRGFGPWTASLAGRFDSRGLAIDSAQAHGYGGRLSATGPLALDGASATDLRLAAEKIDLAALLRDAGAPLPLRSGLDAELRWTTHGLDLERAHGDGRVALQPLPPLGPAQGSDTEGRGLSLGGAAEVGIAGREVHVHDLLLETRGARVEGDVALSSAEGYRGHYRAELPLAALPSLASDLGASTRVPPLAGALVAEGAVSGPLEAPFVTLHLEGDGLATAAAARTATVAVSGDGAVAGGRLTFEALALRSTAGGRALLTGGVPLTEVSGEWDLDGELQALDVAPLCGATVLACHGPVGGRLRVSGPRREPIARADLDARLALAAFRDPVQASLAGSASGSRLVLERLDAALADGQLRANGSFDSQSGALQAKVEADGVRLSGLSLPAPLHGLDGLLGVRLSLSGTTAAPSGEARATLAEVRFQEHALPAVALTAHSDGAQLDLVATASPQEGATPTVFARGQGTPQGRWPLRLEVDTAELPVAPVLAAIPAGHELRPSLSVRGTLLAELPLVDPSAVRYRSERLLASGRLSDLDWTTEPFGVEGSWHEATLHGLRLTARSSSPASPRASVLAPPGGPAGGSLSVDGRVALAGDRSFDLTVAGDLDLAALQRSTGNRLGGAAQWQLAVRGRPGAPDLRGRLAIANGRGRIGSLRVAGLELRTELQGERARLEHCEASLLGGKLTVSGDLPLRAAADGVAASLHLEASDLDVSRLAFASPQRDAETPSFLVSFEGDVEANAPDLGRARGRGRLTRVLEESAEGSLALASPVAWTLEGGRLALEPMRLTGALGSLEGRAELRLAGGPFSGSASALGLLDLRAVGPFLPATSLAGPARVDLRAAWGADGVRLDGGLTVEEGRLTLEDLAFSLTQLRGELRLLGDRATLSATAASADGRLALHGGMTFGPRLLGPAELQLEAQRALVSYPEGFRAHASGALRLVGRPGAYRVEGDVDLTGASYTAEFDQRRESLDRLDAQLRALQGATPVGESLPLALHVRFADPLRIRNQRARLDVAGEFTAAGTLAQPTANGTLSLLEGGNVRVRRGDVRIQDGRVELNGFPAGNMELDVTGSSQLAGIEMDVRARGSFDDLQLDISSPNRPDLSQTDLVSLLLTGRTAQAAAAQSTAIVAEELASALGGVIQKNVGELLLVDVGPERSLLTDDLDPTQRFSVGARLRQDLIVLYSTRLDGTEQRWTLEWNPRGGRLRLRALDDPTQGFAVELADRLSFDVLRRRGARPPRAPEDSRLRAVRFEGALPLPADRLKAAAGLELGKRQSARERERAAERIRQRLVAEGWLGATVDAEALPVAGETGSVEITLRVQAGPRIRISWQGDDPGKDVQARTVELWPTYASPEAAAALLARTARVLLQTDRYYLAQVRPEVVAQGDETEVRLRVSKGPRGRGCALAFEGNTVLGDGALRAALPEPGSRAFFDALSLGGGRLRSAVRIAYARVGYLRAGVLAPRSEFDPATGRLRVVLPIRERGASRVAELRLPPELAAAGAQAPRLRLQAGRAFDLDAYVADRDAIAAWYRDEGWMDARVRGLLEPAGEDLRVRIDVSAGPRTRAGALVVESQGRVAPGMIRRSLAVEPSTLVTPRLLAESRARLSELGVFRSVDVRTARFREGAVDSATAPSAAGGPAAPTADAADAADTATAGTTSVSGADSREVTSDVVVSYVERNDVTLEYGLRFSSSGTAAVGGAPAAPAGGRLQVTSALELPNPLGWGWHLRPFALLTSDRHTFGVALESASLFGLRLRTQLQLSDDDDNRNTGTALAHRIRGVSVQQSRSLLEEASSGRRRDRLRLQWGYADKEIEYFENGGSGTTLAGKRSYFSLSLVGDERDSLTDPHRGVFWTAGSELARRAFGSDVDYLRLYGQLFLYLPLPGGVVWAQGYRAGVAPGSDPLLLLEDRFQAGGPTTVRGYGQNGLGPHTSDGIPLGGQGVVILNQELRFPIFRIVAGGVFWDAGNVWQTAGETRLGDLRQSVGAGLRVMLPFGPLRLEYAWNVGPQRGSGRTSRFVFGLGHAF